MEGGKPSGLMETMDIIDPIPYVGSLHCITQDLALSEDLPTELVKLWPGGVKYEEMPTMKSTTTTPPDPDHLTAAAIAIIAIAAGRRTTSRDLWLSLKKVYAPHSTSGECTLKTQLLRIKMHGDETPDGYLNRAQEYADALAAIGERVKDKDIVMLVVSGLREEYNGLKTTISARQSPTAFSKLHALLSDHDYILGKTRTPIAPYGPQAFYSARRSNNNRSNNKNNHGNRNNSRGNKNQGRDNGRQFNWASTQNTVYGTCNRCGIGHIPSQCLNRDPSTILTRPSANFANTRAQSSNAFENWNSDTRENSHVTPDLEAMDNSEAYYGDDALHAGNEWRQAIKEEYDALMKNETWSLVPRASNTNVVDGKWVYRLKQDKNGVITRYKARFVAKGFRQQPGIDFHETFSLVFKSTTIRAVLSHAVTNDWPLR
nr:hypothetical protein [Tanacetum cinerariifolium]